MNQSDMDWIKNLDPQGMNGTIQSLLFREDLQSCSMTDCLKWLVRHSLDEKQTLEEENKKMANVLRQHGLYTSENLGLE